MALSAGARLGPYEILGPIGEGGMGAVYKARDTRLDRIVAIKVLPPEWSTDEKMKQRFDREAQTIASLKHPHICVLHDVGRLRVEHASASQGRPDDEVNFLVMEYLEGETLTERLVRGPIPLQEALGLAIAIGDAIDKAHRQGVIHRDLKPSNVMLTASGPKLLDFGLAKSQASLPAATSVTLPGTILGTMQYMAPEQLDGAEADRRTDIFSFGVIVHEMVTGKKAFEGKSQVLLISAIATSTPPPLSLVQPETPAALDDLVKTCLEKDPANRWQDARDVVAELRWIAEGGGDADLGGSAARSRTSRAWLRRAAVLAGLTAILVLSWPAYLYLQDSPPPEELRFRVPRNVTAQPDETMGGNSASGGAATFSRSDSAVSPDGQWIVFVGRPTPNDINALYLRPVGAVTPQRLAGTDDATRPFWSPDSRSIAFVSNGKLKKVPATGGRPQDLSTVPMFSGGTWNRDGTILFGSPSGVFRVSEEGGTPEVLTTIDQSETGHLWPHFLPDGRHYLFLAKSGDASKSGVYVGALDSKDRTRVLAVESNAVYTEPGLLVFERAGTVFAQPFDAATRTLSGQPMRVADEVTFETTSGKGDFDVSRNGVLIYYVSTTGSGAGAGEDGWEFQMQWTDRSISTQRSVGPWGVYRGVEVSPDQQRVAVHRHDGTGGDIWVMEPPPRAPKRITFDATQDNSSPVWSHDGARIIFASKRNGKWGLYETRSDGSGTDGDLLWESDLPKAPMSVSPDGKRLVFWVQDPKTFGDIWVLPLEGDKKPVPFLVSSKNETHPQVSPDGKWIAYTSELTGRKEVYVQPFPTGTGRWQISPDAGLGGDWPRWRRDTQELYYHSLGNAGTYGAYTNGSAILGPVFGVSIKATGASIEPGTPIEAIRLLALRYPHHGSDYHTYGVSHDGKEFIGFQRVLTNAAATAQIVPEVPIPGLTVAMHWADKIRK